MKLKPLRDNVVVKVNKAVDKTKGGIIIPDSAKEKPLEGEVISIGPGREMKDESIKPMDVAVGDAILFSKYFTAVSVPGSEDLVIMTEENILAIITK